MLSLVHPLGLAIKRYFERSFFPKNKRNCSWGDWDIRQMGNLTLTHYISKYHSVILKVEGLDNFQKVCGFIRGLNKDYKAKQIPIPKDFGTNNLGCTSL